MIDGTDHVGQAGQSGNETEAKIRFLVPELVRLKEDIRGPIEMQDSRVRAVRSGWHVGKFYSVSASFFLGRYEPGKSPESSNFFIKCFNQNGTNNANLRLSSPPLEIELKLYRIMKDSGVVPNVFYFQGLENALVLEHCGELNSEDKAASLSNPQREELEKLILKNIAKFNAFAHQQTAEALDDDQVREWVKVHKPNSEKAVRYLAEYSKAKELDLDPEIFKNFRVNYMVFEKMYGENGDQLVHGDLRGQNVVGPDGEDWNEGNVKIVDLGSMVRAGTLFSVAQFITSPSSKADARRWDEMLHFYKCSEADALCGVTGGKGIRFRTREMKRAQRRFYSSVLHSSLRGLSKMAKLQKEAPQDYRRILAERPVLESHDTDMFNNISTALRYVARNRKRLGLDKEDYRGIMCLERAVARYRESAVA